MARPFLNIKSISLLKILLDRSKKTRDRSSLLQNWLFNSFAYSVTLVICLPALANARCESPAATLESVEGTVEWSISDDHWQQAVRGDAFCYGDKIRVLEQRAAIRLANETIVRLRENSVVTLMPEDKGFWVELLQGAGHFLSRTPKQLTIKAAYLNAAIDGTEFIVAADGERNRVAVFEGDVRVFNQFGEVRLGEGTETSATATTAPDPARSIRLRDAAEWILYYPPLIIQNQANSSVSALIDKERYAEALNQLDQQTMSAEDATLAASLALISGQPAVADKLLEFALQQNSQLPEANALQALKALTAGDDQAALSQTSALLQTAPENVSVLLAHAYALQSQGKIEEALKINRRALSLTPDNLFILARTAELELSSGNTRAARKLIDRALQKSPNHSRVNTLAGFIALNRFANKEAQTYFRTAINSNDSEPLARLGLALALIQKGKLEQGRAEMEMAVLLDPGSSLLRSYLGKTYAAQDQNDWADTQYQLAKNLDPNDPTPWFYQAHLKHEENKPGEALHLITTAIEKNDNRAVYRSRMLLDSDAAARSANLIGIYRDAGFKETAKVVASTSAFINPGEFAPHHAMVLAFSDDPKAEATRANEALFTQIISPVGAEQLNVGSGKSGLQIPPWLSPVKMGLHEYSGLYTQRGLKGKANSFLGTQGTKGYQWQVSGTAEKVGVNAGQLKYETQGYRPNNDANILLNEINLHIQATPNTKLYIHNSENEKTSGDLGSSVESDLFNETLRRDENERSSIIAIKGELSPSDTVILLNRETQRISQDFSRTALFDPNDFYDIDIHSKGISKEGLGIYLGTRNSINYSISIKHEYHETNEREILEYLDDNILAFESENTGKEISKYNSIFSDILLSPTASLEILTGLGLVDYSYQDYAIDYSETQHTYSFGSQLKLTPNLLISLAHGNLISGRFSYPSQLHRSSIFGITRSNNYSNFSTEKATSGQMVWTINGTSVIIFADRATTVENVLRPDSEPPGKIDRTVKSEELGIAIEHTISDTSSISAKSTYENEYFSGTESLIDTSEEFKKIRNFSTKIEANLYPSKKSRLSLSLHHHIQQRKAYEKTSSANYSSGDKPKSQLFSANLEGEFLLSKQFLLNAKILNIFNDKSHIEHSSLRSVAEQASPAQPFFPYERTFLISLHFFL